MEKSGQLTLVSAFCCLATVFSTLATGQSLKWGATVEPVCGIQMNDSRGGIAFGRWGSGSRDPSTASSFRITSNVELPDTGMQGKAGAYVRVDMNSISDNLSYIGINDSDVIFTVTAPYLTGGEKRYPLDQWQGSSKNALPAGRYDSWVQVRRDMDEIPAGETSIRTTITVSCSR
ncbi:hypothetical protein ACWJJH_19535 [Endozoicomonadaceae bacterium StTr2]